MIETGAREMNEEDIKAVKPIIEHYYSSFLQKTYGQENNDYDFLMKIYNISPNLKRENRQYWGQELGMLWQLLVSAIIREHCPSEYKPALKLGTNEPCDLILGNDAIDTKYRIGSGDSGTLKKFKLYSFLLQEKGYRPVFLIVRKDNLPAAITACKNNGWSIYSGNEALQYIQSKTGVDMKKLLLQFGDTYHIR